MQHKSVVLLNILYYVYDLLAFEKSLHQAEMRCPKSQYMTKAICSNKTCCVLIKNKRNLYEFPPPPPHFSVFSTIFSVFFAIFSVFQAIFFRVSAQYFRFLGFFRFFGFFGRKKIFFSVFDRKKKSEKMETLLSGLE